MKEAIFRAWDSIQNKMSYDVNVYSQGDGIHWWSGDHINPETGDTICSFVEGALMQYIGKKDMEGKKIFKGDVLSVPELEGTKHQIRIIMDWDDDASAWGGFHPNHAYKVIGNIYENPELNKPL